MIMIRNKAGHPNDNNMREDIMKKHDQIGQGNGDNKLTFKELKTVGSLKVSEEKAPRPLPALCTCWPQ